MSVPLFVSVGERYQVDPSNDTDGVARKVVPSFPADVVETRIELFGEKFPFASSFSNRNRCQRGFRANFMRPATTIARA
jgi:hypothetical protein